METWRRGSARLWIVGRIMAALGVQWASRRLTGRRHARAIEEYGGAMAPLIALALLWLLVDSAQRSNA